MEKYIVMLCNMILKHELFCSGLYGTMFAIVCIDMVLCVCIGICRHSFMCGCGLALIT